MAPLMDTLTSHIQCTTMASESQQSPRPPCCLTTTEDLTRWTPFTWYPILALCSLESPPYTDKQAATNLKQTCPKQEWAIGHYLWFTWKAQMKETHDEGYCFVLANCTSPFLTDLRKDLSLCPL